MEDKTNKTGGGIFFSKNWENDDLLAPLLKRTLPSLWAWYSLQAAYKMLFWHLFLLVLYPLRVSVLFYTKEPNMTGSDRGVKYLKIALFTLLLLVSLVSVYGSKYLSRCCSTGLLLPSLPSCSSLLLCLLGLGLWLALLCLPLHIPQKNKQTNGIFNYWGLHSQ